jgi:hypothetical protein
VLPGPEGQIFPANFLTIAQSLDRCSLSETSFASSSATVVAAVDGGFSALAGDGVFGIGFEEADLVAPCDGVGIGAEFARCRYVCRRDVCSPAKRDVAPLPPIMDDPCHPVVVLDIGRMGMPKPVATSRQLAWRIADTMGYRRVTSLLGRGEAQLPCMLREASSASVQVCLVRE